MGKWPRKRRPICAAIPWGAYTRHLATMVRGRADVLITVYYHGYALPACSPGPVQPTAFFGERYSALSVATHPDSAPYICCGDMA